MTPSSGVSLVAAVECANTLGEGVVWDDRSNAALWTDIEGRTLYRTVFPFQLVERFSTPERIGSFGLLSGRSDQLVVAFESGFALFAFESGAARWIDRPPLPSHARFNDGRVDRNGTFWAGAMIEDPALRETHTTALYRLCNGRRADKVIGGIRISNSLCWSPDGTIMYFADTPRQAIWAFDMIDGAPKNRRVFVETPAGAYPDGSTIDADGCLWNAQWGAGRVVRYTPDGRVDAIIETPAPNVTCVAFGGPSLQLILVTSARAELDDNALAKAPMSGNLFVYESPFRGLQESRCALAGFETGAGAPG
ncbi:SMP-30/gluconolactonase/LRE family protein [Amphiplicatus metriothermophilus]|uniref:Sugar lactone lactonase YvrE n=1 Tax=Amphiplicatus metriothermophilus TaxID=1519374 RepID=A0A239PY11_9PROT|nr:SMP-30/gluconolactonase/LRE family protein [Amphiplicatus metriothermophilus]MBB5519815.1 sugar lactone lactonase YvrE [Amphiplicatus metriothermophilus]SNT75145.1 Sugar lactone lactonase YvrE [Amphiplicatus metriothermophilus]